MTYHLNKQNRRNTRLFNAVHRLNDGVSPNWCESYIMDGGGQLLNRKVYKLSPREHKITPIDDMIKEMLDYVNSQPE